jgi:type VI secretion system protein ImpG
MDPRLIRYYNQELSFLREMGAEFAKQFPKIAGRLGVEGLEVSDPYVERLLEGAAFLTSRLQYKLDAEFERFTQRLLEVVYPNFLTPVPSMIVAQFQPDISDANLAKGPLVARGTVLRGSLPANETTACEFVTAHAMRLYPLQVVEAKYFSFAPDLPLNKLRESSQIKGGVRIRIKVGAGLKANQLNLDELDFCLSGPLEVSYKLYELATASFLGAYVHAGRPSPAKLETLGENALQPLGFDDEHALLPVSAQSFQGYRLLQEYFALPSRFLFLRLTGLLRKAISSISESEFELVLLFGRADPQLESFIDAGMFSLFTTPAINLRTRRADRIHVSESSNEFHVIVDRTRPVDFEVHSVDRVTGFSAGSDLETEFLPLYSKFHGESSEHSAYFAVRREQRVLSANQRRTGPRSSYIGSEVFLSVVDPKEAPYRSDLKQLSLMVSVTNRDLPLFMPIGRGGSDFVADVSVPMAAIRCIRGPSRPFAPAAQGAMAWRLISHLSLNYLAYEDLSAQEGAAALREMLKLYLANVEPGLQRQIDGVRSVSSKASVRRLPMQGPIAFARGVGIELQVDEMAFQGASAFLLGAVLERVFARHAAANSFTEFSMTSLQRGPIMQWAPRAGRVGLT